MYKDEIIKLEDNLIKLQNQCSSLKGQETLLSEQIIHSKENIKDYTHKRTVYKKSIEFLTLVQQATKEKIKKGFEQIVTYALRYVYSSDYKFELEFERRGNLQELYFNIKTPDKQKPLDPKDTSGGGVLDILSLALRISLLELIKPKLEGFLVLDEPFRNINGEDYLKNGLKFVEKICEKIKRQIIFLTNKTSTFEIADNLIEIKKEK